VLGAGIIVTALKAAVETQPRCVRGCAARRRARRRNRRGTPSQRPGSPLFAPRFRASRGRQRVAPQCRRCPPGTERRLVKCRCRSSGRGSAVLPLANCGRYCDMVINARGRCSFGLTGEEKYHDKKSSGRCLGLRASDRRWCYRYACTGRTWGQCDRQGCGRLWAGALARSTRGVPSLCRKPPLPCGISYRPGRPAVLARLISIAVTTFAFNASAGPRKSGRFLFKTDPMPFERSGRRDRRSARPPDQFVRPMENSTASSSASFIGALGNSARASLAMAP
jgi:hypothetical protein